MSSTKVKDRITQVQLTRHYNTNSYAVDTAWIRSDLARVGKRVTIENSPEVWTVSKVYGTKSVDDLDGQYHAWREFATKLDR